MCLGPRLLSPTAGVSYNCLFMWLKGSEVGPPNLLQVTEHRDQKFSKNVRTERPKAVLMICKRKWIRGGKRHLNK